MLSYNLKDKLWIIEMAKVIVHFQCMQKSSLDIVLNAYFLVPQKNVESEYNDRIYIFGELFL